MNRRVPDRDANYDDYVGQNQVLGMDSDGELLPLFSVPVQVPAHIGPRQTGQTKQRHLFHHPQSLALYLIYI
jgi:hypothetical protein